MNYEIKNETGLFHVMEMQTGQVIKSFAFIKDAKNLAKRLNSGMGFAGWTPSFLLKDFKIPVSDTK